MHNLKSGTCLFCSQTGNSIQMTHCKHAHVRCCKHNRFVVSSHFCVLCKPSKFTTESSWKTNPELFLLHLLDYVFKHIHKLYSDEFIRDYVQKHVVQTTTIASSKTYDELFWLKGQPTIKKISCLIMVHKFCNELQISNKILHPALNYCYSICYPPQKVSTNVSHQDISKIVDTIQVQTIQTLASTTTSDKSTREERLDVQAEYIQFLMKQAEEGCITYEEANKLMYVSCPNTFATSKVNS